MEDWILFIFKRNRKFYLVNASCEDNAWNQLQKRLSWNMDIVKKQVKLVNIMNSNTSEIIVLE